MPTLPHPALVVALQVRVSNAVRPLVVATYAVWVRWLTSMSPGLSVTRTVGGATLGQPWACAPLHDALSIIDTVPSAKFPTYTVWFDPSAKTPIGADPTGMVAAAWSQPSTTWPLQVTPSMTDTVLSSTLVT